MKRSQRLNRKEQFVDLFKQGNAVDTESFRVLCLENGLSRSRFAAVVNRRFGSAVQRNKVKRVARNLFDRFQGAIRPARDILILPRKSMLARRHNVLVEDFQRALHHGRPCKRRP